MRFEDFGLTAAQVQAAINGSDEACDAVLGQIMESGRFDELLDLLKSERPHAYLAIIAEIFQDESAGSHPPTSH